LRLTTAGLLCAAHLLATAPALAQWPLTQPPPAASPQEPVIGQKGKDVIWVPTPPDLLEAMLDLAQVTARDVVYDLGSGDGRAVIAAARRGARAVGVEYDAPLLAVSRKAAADAGVAKRATFIQGDMYAADIHKATALVLFLLPKNLGVLRPKLLALRPGTRIVINTFTIPEWPFDGEVEIDTCDPWCTARLWIVPAAVAGSWRVGAGTLTLAQTYQRVSGTFTEGATTAAVTGTLQGNALTLQVGESTWSGQVRGTRMQGTRTHGGTSAAWKARR